MIGIYKITNNINHKVYIGLSKNISKRWNKHYNSPFNPNSHDYDKPLYRAIRKYGLNNFTFEVIEECTIEELSQKEKYWINYYNATNPSKGYNLTDGGTDAITKSKITLDEAYQIINLLEDTSLSQEEIAKQFNISQRMVSGINLGQYWIQPNKKYPLRTDKKEKKYCINCGKEIAKNSTYCSKCAGNMRRIVDRPDRSTLKQLIRNKSFVQIGKNFNISDNGIRKWCKDYNLPTTKKEIKSYSEDEWELI